MNRYFIAGHLGADPEVRYTQTGKKVTTIRVATNSREGQADVTIWVRVTIWEDDFANLMPHLKKGSAVMVWGELHKPKIYIDKENKPQTSLEMTAIDIRFSPFGKPATSHTEGASASAHAPAAASFPGAAASPYAAHGTPTGKGETFDDEVPFLKITFLPEPKKTDLLILPIWEGKPSPLESFRGKAGETALFCSKEEGMQLLVGLGKEKKATGETIRRACGEALKAAGQRRAKKITFIPPHGLKKEEIFRAAMEGFFLANYAFRTWKSETEEDLPPPIEEIFWIGPKEAKLLEEIETVVDGVCFARDLINGNADEITPQKLAETARKIKAPHLDVQIHDKKWLEKHKMGLILAVNRGASVDPFLIEMTYRGAPHSKEHVVLVGKGVTYDTGGLALKPAEGMLSMKCDMAGSAVVMATVQTAARLKLKVNVTALIPTVENAIGPHSYKNGDVYRGYSGRTVEIVNTDAEGRLILADALAYAVKNLKPTSLVDLATLTGSIVAALGEEIAGLFASDEKLAKDLLAASEQAEEAIWRFPLPPAYREMLKSDIADTLNSGGRIAGAITAALFLQEFVKDIPWAHLDIAGTAFWSKPKYYNPTKATGFGVRLLIEFLKNKEKP